MYICAHARTHAFSHDDDDDVNFFNSVSSIPSALPTNRMMDAIVQLSTMTTTNVWISKGINRSMEGWKKRKKPGKVVLLFFYVHKIAFSQ